MEYTKLKRTAMERRLDVLEMVWKANTGHIGGSMSCMDLLVALYYGLMDSHKIKARAADRDRFILSKGHCAEALYAVLADRGFFPTETLSTYAAFDTMLAEHPTAKVPGVEAATGALGHGLSLGVGMGIGLLADGNTARIFVLMGDGELAEGSVWEAAMAASKFKLGNVTAIVDRNRLQISGPTEQVMPLEDLCEKFMAFGWACRTCNGHEPAEVLSAITNDRPAGQPLAVLANTTKGYGSAVMENQAEWHHLVPSPEQYEQIKADLLAKCGRD
jgi:transketolase